MEKLEMLEAILDSYPYRVVFVDCDHVIRYLNRAAKYHYYQVRGYRDLIGRSLFDCHQELSRARIEAAVETYCELDLTDPAEQALYQLILAHYYDMSGEDPITLPYFKQ